MGIAPIDLQIMYSQMNNVAKTVANQQQGVQLAQQLQESKIIQQQVEKAVSVKKAADEETKTLTINKDGHRQDLSGGQGGNKKRHEKDNEPPEQPPVFREPYLGNHINITG